MDLQITEQKKPSGSLPPTDSSGKKELEAAVAPALAASKANIIMLENEAEKIMLEAGTDKKPPSSDNAVLSEESKARDVTPEQRKDKMDSWRFEEEAELWNALSGWLPTTGHSIEAEIQELFELYQMLLEAMLKNTQGQVQQQQLGRLENALSLALNHLLKQDMAGLKAFFETYGTKTQVDFLKASIYRMVSGTVLPEKEMERFWQAGTLRSGSSGPARNFKTGETAPDNSGFGNGVLGNDKSGNDRLGSSKAGYQPFTQRGIIYGPKGNEVMGPSSHISAQSAASRSAASQAPSSQTPFAQPAFSGTAPRQTAASGAGISGAAASGGGALRALPGQQAAGRFEASAFGTAALCTAKDLQLSEEFIQYFTKEGNLLQNEYINGRNEEVVGLLLSVASIKSQEFCLSSGISRPMRTQLQTVVDRMIDVFLQQAQREIKGEAAGPGKPFIPMNHRAVYKIYYEVMEYYGRYGNPEKAISEGVRSAVGLFLQKKSDVMFENMARYGEDAGFFRSDAGASQLKKYDLQEDIREGKKHLERDWREFMKYIGKPGKKVPSLVPEEQSFWGMLAEPEHAQAPPNRRHYIGMIVMTLGMAVLLIWILRLA